MKNFVLLSAFIASVVIAPISFAATNQQTKEFLDLYNNHPSQSGIIQESASVTVQSGSEKFMQAYSINADVTADFKKTSGKVKIYLSGSDNHSSYSSSAEGKLYMDKDDEMGLLTNISDVKLLHYDEKDCHMDYRCQEDGKREELALLQEYYPTNEWSNNEYVLDIIENSSNLTNSIYEEDITSLKVRETKKYKKYTFKTETEKGVRTSGTLKVSNNGMLEVSAKAGAEFEKEGTFHSVQAKQKFKFFPKKVDIIAPYK